MSTAWRSTGGDWRSPRHSHVNVSLFRMANEMSVYRNADYGFDSEVGFSFWSTMNAADCDVPLRERQTLKSGMPSLTQFAV